MKLSFDYSRLSWLAAVLADRRYRIVLLLRQMTGLGTGGAMTPAAFGKFLHLIDQIAVERHKEIKLIDRIELVEARHRYLRACRQLVPAAPKPEAHLVLMKKARPAVRKRRLLWLALWLSSLRPQGS